MTANLEEKKVEEGIGSVHISDEVIGVIAALATSGIKGIIGTQGATGTMAELLGKKNIGRGIKVSVAEDGVVTIDAHVTVDYGCKIQDAGKELQEHIKNQVETMTGANVGAVNIHVQGVNMETLPKEEA